MSNYNSLKTTIDANIKQNGRQEITGQILNSVLNQMVTTLGAGYQFAGVATIDTNPGAPDAKVFYIANGKGTYTNFGGLEVTEDDVVVLYWDTAWHKEATGIASQRKLTELKEKIDALALGAFYGYFPDSSSLPVDVTTPGYAYVGLDNPYKIWNFNGKSWSDSGTSIDMNDADEEDITRNADGKLQFKDRAYGDGMGYVILRKNKTFAEQVTQANTIYEIRYDFDLDYGNVEIPQNSILYFVGGTIKNVESLILKSGVKLKGNGNKINYGYVEHQGNGTIENIIFDGEWDCNGVRLAGDNIVVRDCSFLNTKYVTDRGSSITSAIWVGNYEQLVAKTYLHNITIENCVFDGCEPKDIVSRIDSNSTVARFILSYGCENLIIAGCLFKNMKNATYDGDHIQLRSYEIDSNDFPFYGQNPNWDNTTSPYLGYYYASLSCRISNNEFHIGTNKSGIKVMSSNCVISSNSFFMDTNDSAYSSYAAVRCCYVNEINIIANNFVFNTHFREVAISLEHTKKCNVCDNIVSSTENDTLLGGGVFSFLYTNNCNVLNNNVGVVNPSAIFNTECNSNLTIATNKIGVICTDTVTTMDIWNRQSSHYCYPDASTPKSLYIFDNDFIVKSSNITSISLFIIRELGVEILRNKFTYAPNTSFELYIRHIQQVNGIIDCIEDNDTSSVLKLYYDPLSKKVDITKFCIIKQNIVYAQLVGTNDTIFKDCNFIGSYTNRLIEMYAPVNLIVENCLLDVNVVNFRNNEGDNSVLVKNCTLLQSYLSTYIPSGSLTKKLEYVGLWNGIPPREWEIPNNSICVKDNKIARWTGTKWVDTMGNDA